MRRRDGFVLGEGAGVVVVESRRARAGAWRDADRRDPGRRAHRGRVPHLRAGSHRARAGARDDQRHAQRGRGAGRGRLDRRPRDVHVAQRRHRDARDQVRIRIRRCDACDLLSQVDDRAPGWRGRHRSRPGGARRDPRRGDLAHREPPHSGSRSATWTTCRWLRARRSSTPSRSTASASAARTRSRSSAASRCKFGPRPAGQAAAGRPDSVRQIASAGSGPLRCSSVPGAAWAFLRQPRDQLRSGRPS